MTPKEQSERAKEKLAQAKALSAEAARLRKEAFDERPLPKKWRKGQKVRYIRSTHDGWGPGEGTEGVIVDLSPECKRLSAADYQVFWVVPSSGFGIFWTTPDDVELVSESTQKGRHSGRNLPEPSPDVSE